MRKIVKMALMVVGLLVLVIGGLGMGSCVEGENLEKSSSSMPQEVCPTHDWMVVTTMPTCQMQGYDTKTCSVCGQVEKDNYTEVIAHNWMKEYSYDYSFHWVKCNHCEEIKEKVEHTAGKEYKCTICEQLIGATEGIVYEISIDGTYAEVVGYEGEVKNVRIADSYENLPVKTIREKAFYQNQNIVSVFIPNSVTSIGAEAFRACVNLNKIAVDLNNVNYKDVNGDLYNKDGSTLIQYAPGKTQKFCIIPSSVTRIDECAFQDSKTLTTIYYEGSAEEWAKVFIGDSNDYLNQATYYYYSETKTEEEGNYWYYNKTGEIVVWVELKECVGLQYALNEDQASYSIVSIGNCTDENLIIPSTYEGLPVTYVADYAMYGNETIILVIIPNSIVGIAGGAFQYCTNLESVVIGDGVEFIGDSAFYYCRGLVEVTIGEGVTSINYRAFRYCISLVDIVIPDGVAMIGEEAFYGCENLESVVIGSSVTDIEASAFKHCDMLTNVYYKGSAEEWENITVGVSNEKLIGATRYYYSEDKPTEEGNYWHYDENGKVVVWE